MEKYLVSVETVKIKEFLFSTNKLKCIQGASYLLDYINNVGIREVLNKYGIKNTKISYFKLEEIFEKNGDINELYNLIKDDDVIYIAAGNAKFFVNYPEEIVLKIKDEIEKLYLNLAPNSKIVIEYVKVNETDNISNIIYNLSKKVAIKKNLGFFINNIDLPYLKKCKLSKEHAEISHEDLKDYNKIFDILSNGRYEKLGKYDYVYETLLYNDIFEYIKSNINVLKEQLKNLCDSKYYISTSTFLKIVFSNLCKEISADSLSFYNLLSNKFPEFEIYSKIEDYAEVKNDRFIGFMYSDGDSLGDYIRKSNEKYQTNEEYLKFIKTFSIKLDYVTKSSLLDSLNKNFEENDKKIGAFLIVGGDDVCALFEVSKSLNVCMDYVEIFEEKMKKLNMNEITTSSGLLFVKPSVPIHLMFEQSLILQKNSKNKRFQENDKKGYIDFQNISSQGNTSISAYRQKLSEYNVINRAYKVENFKKLLSDIKNLKKSKFPKNKLRKIYEIKTDKDMYPIEKNWAILNYLFKIKNQNIVQELWDISKFENINEQSTNVICDGILDIIELYDYLEVN